MGGFARFGPFQLIKKGEYMKTLKSLVEKSHINEKLIRAVVRQIGGWESFTQSAPDITNHGIDG